MGKTEFLYEKLVEHGYDPEAEYIGFIIIDSEESVGEKLVKIVSMGLLKECFFNGHAVASGDKTFSIQLKSEFCNNASHLN